MTDLWWGGRGGGLASEHTLVEESERSERALLKPLLLLVLLLTPLPPAGEAADGGHVTPDGGREETVVCVCVCFNDGNMESIASWCKMCGERWVTVVVMVICW